MHVGTILVPYDFSDYAARAFAWARDLADTWKAKIVLFHAVPPFPRLAYSDAMSLDALSQVDIPKLEAELLADAETRLKDVMGQHATASVSVEAKALISDPFWGICQIAEDEQVDLIVMGSHGRTGLAHVFLGSIAERVVRHAPCPVMVVRLPRQAS